MTKKVFGIMVVLAVVASLPALAADQPTKFTLSISGLLQTRAAGSTIPLVSSDYENPGTGDIFKSSDVPLDAWKMGADITVGYVVWNKFGVEARAFTLGKQGPKTAQYVNPASGSWMALAVETGVVQSYGLPANGTLDITNRDDKALWGFEFNGTYDLSPRVRVYAGFRYMRLEQSFQMYGSFIDSSDSETDLWTAENKLIGGQIGARYDILSPADAATPGWTLQGHGAFLLFSNSTDLAFVCADEDTVWITTTAKANKIAPGADAGFQVGYRLNSMIEVHAGYDLLWVGNVCEAVRQLAGMDTYYSTTIPPQYKSLIVHGAKAGVTIRF